MTTTRAPKVLTLVGDAFGGDGGIARYNRDLLTALANEGAEIVILPRGGHRDPAPLPAGIHQQKPRGRLGFVLAAALTAWRDGPFDAVFCGHLHLAPAAALIAMLLRVPLWLQLHGVEAWRELPKAQHLAVKRAALITAVSRHTRHRFLERVRIDPWRLRVLPNTVDPVFSPGAKPGDLLDRHGLRGRTVLLTVGRLAAIERGKGHDRVIAVLPALAERRPDIIYLIVGDGDDRARLEALARAHDVVDRVVFAGAVAAAALPDYYRAANLFVMPSTQEGFGIVLLEAAASGLTVVAGNLDGSVDALADGALGRLIDPADPVALAVAIHEMLDAGLPSPALVEPYRMTNFTAHAAALLDELVNPPALAFADPALARAS